MIKFLYLLLVILNYNSEWHNLKILFDFSEFKIEDKKIKELFENNIISIIKDYVYLTFKVKEEQQIDLKNIYKTYSTYSLFKKYGNILKGYDYICKLAIINENNSTLGQASEFQFHLETGRPIISLIEINIHNLDSYSNLNKRFIDYFFLILHELFHGFGYNIQAITRNKIKINYNSTDEQYVVESPKVIELAKKHFNCSTLNNLRFENNSSRHWENIQLNNDIQLAFKKSNTKISEITLAIFEDFGWFKINYDMGEILPWGLKKGCEFINNPSDKFEEFGKPNEIVSCSIDYLSTAFYVNSTYTNNLNLKNNLLTCRLLSDNYNSCIDLINDGNCSKSRCVIKDNILNIEYTYFNKIVFCNKNNQILEQNGIKFKCPNIERFCDYRYECKNQCSGKGYCLNGNCICNRNYKGFACEFEKTINNDYDLNKKCNFNGYYNNNNKCICYDNYSGINCEKIIIDKGSFGSKCKESTYVKCYKGEYYNYLNKENIKNTNNTNNTTNNNINDQKNTNKTEISIEYINLFKNITFNINDNCFPFCNQCNRTNNLCENCSYMNDKSITKLSKKCNIPENISIFSSCKNIIQMNSNNTLNCIYLKNNIPECRIVNENNECIYCKTDIISNSFFDFYYDSQEKSCKQVKNKINFCKKYINSNTCIECFKGYKLNSNKCLINLIPCLETNLSNSKCNKCTKKSEFILNDKCWDISQNIAKLLSLFLIININ